jgi:hypothetical protein
MGITQTIVNGVEYKNYDKFCELLARLEKYYITQNDYSGYPKLANEFCNATDLFKNAKTEEQKYMFSILFIYFDNALRHWKVDIDKLYTENGRKEHEEFLEKYKTIITHLGDVDSFHIGIS